MTRWTRFLNMLCIGVVMDLKPYGGIVSMRSWKFILLNPLLRVFGWQLVYVQRDWSQIDDCKLISDCKWTQFCRCERELNIFRGYRDSFKYDLREDDAVFRWTSDGMEHYSKSGYGKTSANDV